MTYKPFWRSEAAAAKPKISFLSNFPLRGGGCGGGAANKNDRKFLGFASRELVERGRGASVSRQNPADFVRNTFELRPIHTAKLSVYETRPDYNLLVLHKRQQFTFSNKYDMILADIFTLYTAKREVSMDREYRLRQTELYRVARNEILNSLDPEAWIDRDGLEEHLAQTMNDIQDYIDASERMDADPLDYLRKYFPDFEWEFHEDFTQVELLVIMGCADYIWPVGGLYPPVDQCITARKVGRDDPQVFFFCPARDRDVLLMSELRSILPNIRFVFNGSETNMGTFIK